MGKAHTAEQQHRAKPFIQRLTVTSVLILFMVSGFLPDPGSAQMIQSKTGLTQSEQIPSAGAGLSQSRLVGVTLDTDNAWKMDFLIETGKEPLDNAQKQSEYRKLIRYFLASLAIPDKDQWVNLSPFEQDRIIADNFGRTQMGRDLLHQDYLLKQITASLLNPASASGKDFWNKVYTEASQKYGTIDIPLDTLSKIWIIPDTASIYESGPSAIILSSHLKVLLEKDYLALKNEPGTGKEELGEPDIETKYLREIIVPAMEHEVNTGPAFAPLRQITSGMILATWYKERLSKSLLGRIYADRSRIKGIDQNPAVNRLIYHKYLRAFRDGAFNLIREESDLVSGETVPRKYFAGGFHRSRKGINTYSWSRLPDDTLIQGQSLEGSIDKATVALERTGSLSSFATDVLIFLSKNIHTPEDVLGLPQETILHMREVVEASTPTTAPANPFAPEFYSTPGIAFGPKLIDLLIAIRAERDVREILEDLFHFKPLKKDDPEYLHDGLKRALTIGREYMEQRLANHSFRTRLTLSPGMSAQTLNGFSSGELWIQIQGVTYRVSFAKGLFFYQLFHQISGLPAGTRSAPAQNLSIFVDLSNPFGVQITPADQSSTQTNGLTITTHKVDNDTFEFNISQKNATAVAIVEWRKPFTDWLAEMNAAIENDDTKTAQEIFLHALLYMENISAEQIQMAAALMNKTQSSPDIFNFFNNLLRDGSIAAAERLLTKIPLYLSTDEGADNRNSRLAEAEHFLEIVRAQEFLRGWDTRFNAWFETGSAVDAERILREVFVSLINQYNQLDQIQHPRNLAFKEILKAHLGTQFREPLIQSFKRLTAQESRITLNKKILQRWLQICHPDKFNASGENQKALSKRISDLLMPFFNALDSAQADAMTPDPRVRGGVDLNAKNLALDIQTNTGIGGLPILTTDMAQFNDVMGLIPVIQEIRTGSDSPALEELRGLRQVR